MEMSIHFCFCLIALSIVSVCVSGMPALGTNDRDLDPARSATRDRAASISWPGTSRGRRRTSFPSRFDTQFADLNRNPTYYNYHTVSEQSLTGEGSSVGNSRPRQRRSPLDFGSGSRRFDLADARFPADDILRPTAFRDDQPRQPERTPWSPLTRTECIEGGPSCTPRPTRKYFDFYT